MNPVFAVFLTVLLGSSMYLAGRLHARVGYRFGYRYGYRQGYFDGDRACWNRRRRESQADLVDTGETRMAAPAPRAPQPRSLREQPYADEGVPFEVDVDAYEPYESEPVPRDGGDLAGTTYASAAALGRHNEGFAPR